MIVVEIYLGCGLCIVRGHTPRRFELGVPLLKQKKYCLGGRKIKQESVWVKQEKTGLQIVDKQGDIRSVTHRVAC